MAALARSTNATAWTRALSKTRVPPPLFHRQPQIDAAAPALSTADRRWNGSRGSCGSRRTYLTKREARAADIENLAEEKQMGIFKDRLGALVAATASAGKESVRRQESADVRASGSSGLMSFALGGVQPEVTDSEAGVGAFAAAAAESKRVRRRLSAAGLDEGSFRVALDAAVATMALHRESRIASMLGEGFYTIGPCGEEGLGAVGWVWALGTSHARMEERSGGCDARASRVLEEERSDGRARACHGRRYGAMRWDGV